MSSIDILLQHAESAGSFLKSNKSQSAARAVFIVPPGVHLLDLSGAAHIIYEAAAAGAAITLDFVSVHAGQTEAGSTSGLGLGKLTDYSPIVLGPDDFVFCAGAGIVVFNKYSVPDLYRAVSWVALCAATTRRAYLLDLYRRISSGCGRLAG